MTDGTETFHISLEAAEIYEERFVPALFGQWAPLLVDAAGIGESQSVLDVACGTGVVARVASERVGVGGRIVGVDLNPAMLTVARRLRPDIEWHQGDAADLPFPDASFDVVACQSALMFIPDQGQALGEMARVVSPGGTVVVQVFDSLEAQPAYGPWVEMVAGYGGPDAVDLLSTYFNLGDHRVLTKMVEAAGLNIGEVRTHMGTIRFQSSDEMVATEVGATPLAQRLDMDVLERIRRDSRRVLAPFEANGGLEVPIGGYLIAARRGTPLR